MISSTTGKSSSIINTCTIVFSEEGLGLPMSNKTCRSLPYQLLMKIQSILKYLEFLGTDEFSMLRPRDLYHVDLRLWKIVMKSDIPFGGFCVLLVGYPAQIPPVIGYSLY